MYRWFNCKCSILVLNVVLIGVCDIVVVCMRCFESTICISKGFINLSIKKTLYYEHLDPIKRFINNLLDHIINNS